jgi:uncharacterized membrane protein
MPEDPARDDRLNQIIQRLDYLEFAVRDQIARLYAIEKHLGLSPQVEPLPATATPEPAPPVEAAQAVESLPFVDEPPLASHIEMTAPPPPEPELQAASVSAEPAPVFQPSADSRPHAAHSGGARGRESRNLETLIGGSWFNRIGIAAIIIGTGLFLRLAFEREWVGPAGRVLIGVALGIGFLLGGERLRARGYRHYAQGLSGGGIAILYLAFFAAFARYQVIGQAPAFLLMSLVTSAAVLLAARYDALAIAVLGLIGGFLTPVLLSTGVDNQVGLFSYVTLLNLGVLAVAYFKQWRVLNYLAFGATALMTAGWMIEWYAPEKLWTTVFFLTLLFVVFALLAVFHNVINRRPTRWPDIALVFANAFLYFTTTHELLADEYRPYLGLFAVLMSAFYVGFGYLAYTRDREDNYLVLTFLGLASLFLTLAVPIQLDQHWVTMGWAVEGAILVWIGLRANSFATRVAAAAVFAVAVLHWFAFDVQEFGYFAGQSFTPLLNRRASSALALILSFAFAARVYLRASSVLSDRRDILLGAAYLLAFNSLAVILLTKDTVDYYSQAIYEEYLVQMQDQPFVSMHIGYVPDYEGPLEESKLFAITLIWSLYGSVALAFGVLRKLRPLRFGALALLVLTATKVLTLDSQFYASGWHALIFNRTFGAYILLVASLALAARWYLRAEVSVGEADARLAVRAGINAKERRAVLPLLVAATSLLLLVALSAEASGYFTAKMARIGDYDQHERYGNLRQFSLTTIWALYAGAALIYGITRRFAWMRLGALSVLALGALKLLAFDAQYFGLSSHAPVFNPSFLSYVLFVMALAAGLWFYSQVDDGIGAEERRIATTALMIAVNVFAILALSLESNGYFTIKLGGVDAASAELRDLRLARQLSLSVIWAVYGGAMLFFGLRRGSLLLRVMALILLGVTIIKVFFFDLRSLDTVYRIASFIVLGAILLGVSFLYQQWQRRAAEGE